MAKVAVALSGGVDSAVAAIMLREAGHEVVGLTLDLGVGPREALAAAPETARDLGIDHMVVRAAGPFETHVLGPCARAYAEGKTPNPCAVCNAKVKFPLLWQAARAAGCQALATGHYARIDRRRAALFEGADRGKSQAYFLARLDPGLLDKLLFPLGEMHKSRTWEVAAAKGLAARKRPESQDGCFLPPGGWDQIMRERGLTRPGPVEDAGGRRVGSHPGVHRFTIGQRRGLGVALGSPAYVWRIDGARAAVMIGPKDMLATRGLLGERPLWHGDPAMAGQVTVRYRYNHAGVECMLRPMAAQVEVKFAREQGAVAPGQLAVFFVEGRVLGSAWIQSAISSQQVVKS